MVRTVQFDEAVQQFADQRMLKRAEAEVGILIGRSTAGKDFLLQLVRSPDQDGDSPIQITSGNTSACSKQKGKTSATSSSGSGGKLTLDEEWIVEHAAQAARTLPGGLDILGIYILCDDKTFQAGHGVVINAIKAISKEIFSSPTNTAPGATSTPLLALHIDSVTAKIAAREVSGATLKACEAKPSNVLANMVEVQCQFHVDLKVNLAGGKQRLHDAIQEAVLWQSEHVVQPAVALIDNKIPDVSQQIVDMQKNEGQSLSIELLTPLSMPPATLAAVGTSNFTDLPPSAATGKGEYQRQAEFALQGALDCRAFVHKREPLTAAVEAIKGDVERTLLTRIDILVEAAQMATDEAEARFNAAAARDAKLGKQTPASQQAQAPKHPLLLRVAGVDVYNPTLPRRAFLRWNTTSFNSGDGGGHGGGCSFCDYIVEGEGMSEAVQRVQELMGADSINPSTFQCEEKLAAGVLAGKAGGKGAGSGRRKNGGAGFECNVATAGAISVALLAMYLSWTFMS